MLPNSLTFKISRTTVAHDKIKWAPLTRAKQMHTHGSYIEEKGTAILWHYGDAEPEFGAMQVCFCGNCSVFVVIVRYSVGRCGG